MELRNFVVFSQLETAMEMKDFGEFRVGYVGNTVGKICFVFDFILHTACTEDESALTTIQPSLSLIDVIHCTP
jgi:hypothetical protein